MQGKDQGDAPRIHVIDAFRGVAIICVLLFHYLIYWAPPFQTYDLYGYSHRYPPALELTSLGVEVFFVISGLVIAMTLAQCRSTWEFVVKRFARLYPAYIAAATVTFLVMVVCGPSVFKTTFSDYLVGFTMDANDLQHPYVEGAYWSLAVELKFYVFAAIGYFLLRQNFWLFLVGLTIAADALVPFTPGICNRILIVKYMPLFLFGLAAWLGLLAQRRREALVTVAVAAVLYAVHLEHFGLGYVAHWAAHVFILGVSGLIIVLLWLVPGWRLGPLAFVGRISYSFYLLHNRIGVTLIGALTARGAPDWLAFLLAVAVMGTLAWIFFRLVEEPGRKAVMTLYRRLRQPSVEPKTSRA
jgi:peptidoglycan/LPS O-acetylase OafA/YrhL